MQIGPYTLASPLILSPMAGITDRPFRILCRRMGAAMAVSEMTASDPVLRDHPRTQLRRDHSGEPDPRSVQIVGTDPQTMADAARFNVDQGAQIIDINMGCPAKKVCKVAAGSALLRDEPLVKAILNAVVSAVSVPVSLKIRTGWDTEQRNAETIARIAEDSGIQMLAVHGRTRACGYKGEAEYDTIAAVKAAVGIPVMANGDITSPEKAAHVLSHTGADGLLIGRGAQGRPWIFGQINHFLKFGARLPDPSPQQRTEIVLAHLHDIHQFYGERMGVRIARKHIAWYMNCLPGHFLPLVKQIHLAQDSAAQLWAVGNIFNQWMDEQEQAA